MDAADKATAVKVVQWPQEGDFGSIMFCDNKCKFMLQQTDKILTYEKLQITLQLLIHDF